MSDVPGDDLADIGSGPCAPDALTARDVTALLRRARLLDRLPPPMPRLLVEVEHGSAPETPKPGDAAFDRVQSRIIASNRLALAAVAARAAGLGLPVAVIGSTLVGDAAGAGTALAHELVARAARGERGCVVWGGETTVRLENAAPGGGSALGGRCQELALAAAHALHEDATHGKHVMLLAAGTDGRDGPTDAAGAFADAEVWSAARRSGVDVEAALARHASYDALAAARALFRPGVTGTNVMDVVIGLVA